MVHKFLSNLILIIFINILVKPFWLLGIDRSVQNVLGFEYGFYYFLFNISLIFSIVLDLGINNFNSTEVARNNRSIERNFPAIMGTKLLLAALYLILTFCWGIFGEKLGPEGYKILGILIFNQVLAFYITFVRSNFSGLLLFKTDALMSVMDKLIMILICSWLLWGQDSIAMSIELFVYAQSFAYILTLITCLILVKPGIKNFTIRWNPSLIKSIIRRTYPYAILALLMTVYTRIDTILIGHLLIDWKVQLTLYAQAYRLLDAVTMLGILIASLLLPIFASMLGNNAPVKRLLDTAFAIVMVSSIIFCITCFFFREPIMDFLYDFRPDNGNTFGLLIFSFIPICANYIYGTFLTAARNLKLLNFIAVTGVILNILLNLILIPKFQTEGAALASLITQSVAACFHFYYTHKRFEIPVNYLLIGKIILIAAICIGIMKLSADIDIFWINKAILCSLTAFAFTFILKVFEIKDVRYFLQYRKFGGK